MKNPQLCLLLTFTFLAACSRESDLVEEVGEKQKNSPAPSRPIIDDGMAENQEKGEESADSESRDDLRYFLQSEYEPLQNWMNETFEVKYRAMTPSLMFDQVPLNDIHFKTADLEGMSEVESFTFESEKISRRELLKEIADYWDLDMKYEIGEDGNPIAVVVFPAP